MRLKISHTSQYDYDMPVAYALQRLRLSPLSGPTQQVMDWSISIDGAQEQVRYFDQFGNDTRLVSVSEEPHVVVITAHGEIETADTAGVFGPHAGFAPLWLFRQQTPLTRCGPLLRALAEELGPGSDLDRMHALLAAVRARVAYMVGATSAATTAEEALAEGRGVCQDHSHIFLAAVRHLGYPGRYISGYLMMDDRDDQVASHAWAEVHLNGLGWVGFDVSNGISPDGRYVRLAVGRDYRDAMPTSGIRLGASEERLAVHITVEQ